MVQSVVSLNLSFLFNLKKFKLFLNIKVGINGASCSTDTDCLNGAETTTSYFYCASLVCSCRTGFTWDSSTYTCKCGEAKEVSGTGTSVKCRMFSESSYLRLNNF